MNSFLQKKIARYIPKGSSARNVATLVSGTALGQLAVVLSSPILTRLYTPDDFGLLAVYAAVLGMLGVVAGLRYELAIPLPKSTGGAANLLALTLMCVAGISLLLISFILAFQNKIPLWLKAPAIADYVFLIPLGVFLTGVYQAFNYWAIRRKNFSSIARTSVQQGIAGAGLQIAFGLLHAGSLGLLIGQVVGQTAGIWLLVRDAYKNDKAKIQHVRWSRIVLLSKKYVRFPKFTTWQALLNTTSSMLPMILFASLLSPSIAGLYILAHKTLSLPLSLFGRSIGQVFHSRAAEAYHRGTLDQLTLTTFRRLLQIGLGPLILIGILAPDLFSFTFGSEWRPAGIYARWMVPWLIVQFVVSPLSVVTSVTGHQFGELVSQVLFFLIRIGTILIGTLLLENSLVIELFALSGAIVYVGFLIWIVCLLKIRVKMIVSEASHAMPAAFIFTATAVIFKLFIQ